MFCPLEPAWGDVGTWVSGIASFAAVLVALHLARRADKPNARATLSVLIATPDLSTKILAFQVSNLGSQPLRVSSCYLEFPRIFHRLLEWPSAIANNWQHELNWSLPADIDRGATFFYGTTGKGFASYLAGLKLPTWIVVRFVRAGVSTPWGGIPARIDKNTRDFLRKQIVEFRQAEKR